MDCKQLLDMIITVTNADEIVWSRSKRNTYIAGLGELYNYEALVGEYAIYFFVQYTEGQLVIGLDVCADDASGWGSMTSDQEHINGALEPRQGMLLFIYLLIRRLWIYDNDRQLYDMQYKYAAKDWWDAVTPYNWDKELFTEDSDDAKWGGKNELRPSG